MSYNYLGNIANIPNYQRWSQKIVGPNTIADSPEILREAKIAGRQRVADRLGQEFGYGKSEVTGADPEDFSKWGISDDRVVLRLADLLGLIKPSGRVQLLAPGAMVPLHLDNLRLGYIDGEDQAVQKNIFTEQEKQLMMSDSSSIARVLIFLEDWRHGQAVLFEDKWYDHWRAGDIVTWEWTDGIHATVNCGYWERPLLRLSGQVSNRFREFCTASTKFNLSY